MNTVEINPKRSMASVCRRREQLQSEGVRPETLAWAVAEVSEDALRLVSEGGVEMVRACLEQARDTGRSGQESEALIVLSAAGVNALRQELRSVGVTVSLTRNEAFRAIRLAEGDRLDHEAVFRALGAAGPRTVLEILHDRAAPFTKAIVDRAVEGEAPRGDALCRLAAFGPRQLHRGLKVDARRDLRELGLDTAHQVLASDSPRKMLRQRSADSGEGNADQFAALSLVQNAALRRAARLEIKRARKSTLQEVRRMRQEGRPAASVVFGDIRRAGAAWIMELVADPDCGERELADRAALAADRGEQSLAASLTRIACFGTWRLRRGLRVDVEDEVREIGGNVIAEMVAIGSPRTALMRSSRRESGVAADLLAVLSLVDESRLERSVSRVLRQRVAVAFEAAAEHVEGEGREGGFARVATRPPSVPLGLETIK